ncbi:hypothetical protein [Ottowia testudinis]|uniref:Uncharacterized protein n=1 Tax=Ottowia testudinis TaxID=2816950 RepID=A0A975H4F8_9BURK|nr:hypothetical protein [Ottowia testudinis]QTD46276.1 hypothetical protein J1M35_05075 [Ottowia testudinis]
MNALQNIAACARWVPETAVFHAESNTFERKGRRGFAKSAEVFLDEFFASSASSLRSLRSKKSKTIAALAFYTKVSGRFLINLNASVSCAFRRLHLN